MFRKQGRVEGGGHWAMAPPQKSKFYIRYRTESEKSPRTTLDWPKNKGWPPPRAISKHAPGGATSSNEGSVQN